MNNVLASWLLWTSSLLLIVGLPQSLQAQCVPDVTVPNVPGLYPDSLNEATGCQYFEQDVTFVFPRDTTVSIAGNDIVIPFISFTIDSVVGMPQGMGWACNLAPACEYIVHPDSADADTFGCVRFFGTPTIPATYPMVVHFTALADAFGTPSPQPSTFPVSFLVEACSFEGDCYSLDLDANCTPAVLSFTNQIPATNAGNYSYQWDITGPNSFLWTETSENPAPLTLMDAGTYVVSYQADVDTVGFFLDSVSIQAVNCDDLIGDADLYWYFIAPNGDTITNTINNPVNNGGGILPLNAGIGGFLLDTGTYAFEVWDADDLFGDDDCSDGNNGISIAIPPAQSGPISITNNGLTVIFGISNPIQQVSCSDTIEIFATPPVPVLTEMATGDTLSAVGVPLCAGDTLFVMANDADSIQWYQDGMELVGETGLEIAITETGLYHAVSIALGSFCPAESEAFMVDIISTPAPNISLDGNLTFTIDTPDPSYTYAWFELTAGPVGNGTSFSPSSSGTYYAVATDTLYGCESAASATVPFIPTGLDPLAGLASQFLLFPNPNNGSFSLRVELLQAAQAYSLRLTDLPGRLMHQESGRSEGTRITTDMDLDLPGGMYILSLMLPEGAVHRRVVIQ